MHLFAMIGAVAVALSLAVAAKPAAAACAPADQAAVAGLLDRLNQERHFAGLTSLRAAPALMVAAQGHACDMAERGFFDHVGSDGASLSQRIARTGYSACLAAENIAFGQQGAVAVSDVWMGSAGHRANILRPRVQDIGVGRAEAAAGGGPRWVLVLAAPC
ncbi:CAP domain-containing protein [Plastorhodobacter daqingensis]|uniref:CAP domain-containing protein n=1 Tax=Plastorhodobacter daqingensis TaxID=1387281 RepID=A0ABW2UGL1_9RHOB